jgi:diadenylate cyclase
MAEQSDAVVLIVSEESGAISLAYDAKLYYDLSVIEVTRKLIELLDKGGRKETPLQAPDKKETSASPEDREVLIE